MRNVRMNANMAELIYPDLNYKLVGILYRIHNELGNHYHERYYQRALAKELEAAGLVYEREIPLELHYRGSPIGKYVADFMIEDKIFLELKTVPRLSSKDLRQVRAYLKAKKLRLGLLVNFRSERLNIHRILNPLT